MAQFDIGDILRDKRLYLKQTIEEVASIIKLSPTIIENIEHNKFSEVGTPVYIRGYLGLYAKHLGVDAAYLIEQYDIQHPSEKVTNKNSLKQSTSTTTKVQRHSKALSLLVTGAVVAGLFYVYFQAEKSILQQNKTEEIVQEETGDNATVISSTDASNELSTVQGEEQGQSSIDTVIDNANAVQNLADDVLNGEVVIGNTLMNGDSINPALNTEAVADNTVNNTASTIVLESNTQDDNSRTNQNNTIELESSQKNKEDITDINAGEKVTLRIKFKEDCWIKVTNAKNKVIKAGIFGKNKKLVVKSSAPLKAIIGKPNAIISTHLNSKMIKLSDYQIDGINYKFPNK